MSGVIPRNLKKRRLYLKPFFLASTNAAYTQTHTHTDTSIAIGEMQCVAFRLKIVEEGGDNKNSDIIYIYIYIYIYNAYRLVNWQTLDIVKQYS